MISPKRFFQWVKILHGTTVSIPQWIKILRASLRLLINGRVTRPIWRSRMQVCFRCPLYNVSNKQCKPQERPDLGCGCYAPYLALVKENQCWGRAEFGKPFGWKIYLVPVSTIVNYILLIAAIFLLRKGTSSFLISDFYNEKVTTNFKKAGNIFVFIGISTIVIQLFAVVSVLSIANNMMQMKTNFLITIINTLVAAVDLKSALSIIIGLFFMLFSKIFENSRLLKQENDLTI